MNIIRCFSWFFVLFLLCSLGCSEDHSDKNPNPVVLSPPEGSIYYSGEALMLKAEIAYYPGFSHMEIFLDESFLFETDHQLVDTLLPAAEFSVGWHTIQLTALYNSSNISKSEVSFEFEHNQDEASDLESFSADQVDGWSLSGWSLATISADGDQGSLHSTTGQAVALTRKTFEEAGSLSFFVNKGSGKLEFFIDGEIKSKWFNKDDWGYYGYTVPAGTHVFRWTSDSADTYIDRVEFTPGIEQHSLGEVYGGGIIFHLDSTGLHGLIAAHQDGKYNGNPEIPWGCYGLDILTGNRAQSNTDGAGNTWAIINACDLEQIAARYCFDLITSQGESMQDDWYLPAINELNTLYKNRAMLDGLDGQYYWSSTSPSSNVARVQSFVDGSHHGAHRNIPNINGPSTAAIYVRPIRKF